MALFAVGKEDIQQILWQGAGLQPAEQAMLLLPLTSSDEASTSLANLTVGERNRRLLQLWQVVLGSSIAGFAVCPDCTEPIDFVVSLPELVRPRVEQGVFELESSGYRLCYRLPICSDLLQVAAVHSQKRRWRMLVARCMLSAQYAGSPVQTNELPAAQWEALEAAIKRRDPQIGAELWLKCPICDNVWPTEFDVAEVLWSELTRWAQ